VRSSLPALVGWLHHSDRTVDVGVRRGRGGALADCFAVLSGLDLIATVHQPGVDGELLGPLDSALRSRSSVQATGAFFTPMHIGMLAATMTPPAEGASVVDPACGAGGLAVAAARMMRTRRLDPATCRWLLNDVDPIAVALAAVNSVVHGLGPSVVLRCGDGLLLGTDGVDPRMSST